MGLLILRPKQHPNIHIFSVFGDICAQAVANGDMPEADTYILLSPNNEGGLYGIANPGWNYGNGVCATNIARRASINWYETSPDYDDDLLTALVNSMTKNMFIR